MKLALLSPMHHNAPTASPTSPTGGTLAPPKPDAFTPSTKVQRQGFNLKEGPEVARKQAQTALNAVKTALKMSPEEYNNKGLMEFFSPHHIYIRRLQESESNIGTFIKNPSIDTLPKSLFLGGTNLIGADLRGADLSGALLSRTDLSGAKLIGAKLIGTDLIETNLNESNLRWADLTGAFLIGAILRWANLTGADLTRAFLNEADLSGAILRWANLRGADLRWADLRGAVWGLKGDDYPTVVRNANHSDNLPEGLDGSFDAYERWYTSRGLEVPKEDSQSLEDWLDKHPERLDGSHH